jgi:hypothetical protein
MANDLIPVNDLKIMAQSFVNSKLFGLGTVDQAMALFFVAQSEGIHPATAAKEYNIIQGKPALKADAMLARFQKAGGKVKWITMTDEKVSAEFSHEQGGSIVIDWDMARAKKAQIGGKDNWNKYPRQMLRARVISEGVRTVYPGVIIGVYTPEEVADFTGTTLEATSETPTVEPDMAKVFTVHDENGMTQEQKKALYEEAEQALEVVSDENEYASWVDQYDRRLKLNISKARYDAINAKAHAVEITIKSKVQA